MKFLFYAVCSTATSNDDGDAAAVDDVSSCFMCLLVAYLSTMN